MSESPNLNINNYSIEELLNILDINYPINEEQLLEHGKGYIEKYLIPFFLIILNCYLAVFSYLFPTKSSSISEGSSVRASCENGPLRIARRSHLP